jgi:hypothetical protein
MKVTRYHNILLLSPGYHLPNIFTLLRMRLCQNFNIFPTKANRTFAYDLNEDKKKQKLIYLDINEVVCPLFCAFVKHGLLLGMKKKNYKSDGNKTESRNTVVRIPTLYSRSPGFHWQP